MLKKSCLLEYLIACSEKLKKNDGKKALSANYFMISLLKTIDAINNNQIPREIDTDEAKTELETVRSLLKKYSIDMDKIDTDKVIKAISDDITSSEYKSFMDEIMFGKLNQNAEMKAKSKGRDTIDTVVYLEMIIAEPTASIKKHVLSQTAGGKSDNGAHTADILEQIKQWTSGTESIVETSKEAPLDRTSTEAPVGMTRECALPNLVQTTRNIQNFLLENVFGQDQAVNSFVSGYFQAQLMAYSRKGTKKPQATFLFAGPPGVGKTFLAEKSAEALGLPYRRFDMSEYSDNEAVVEFCGSDNVYKNGKPGNVTEFVANNSKCVVLFDEIEKAHLNVIYLFLQILDAGRIRDNFTDKEVSFSNAVIIFTTNVGKNLYDDPAVLNLSAVPRKKILKALASDIDPVTKAPLFPAAICSRFASGNVVMFNHLEANNLYTIARRELENNVKGFEEATGIRIHIDGKVPSAIMFAEGGKADARTVKGRANAFFHEELYELFRLLSSAEGASAIEKLTRIEITLPLEQLSGDISAMFENPGMPEVLVFASRETEIACRQNIRGEVQIYAADTIEQAKEILFNHDVCVVLCDVNCGVKNADDKLLNAEDISSVGRDFLTYVLDKYSLPVYILQAQEGDITREEFLSFAKLGVRDVLTLNARHSNLTDRVLEKCKVAYQQGNMMKLARENKALSYTTYQTVSEDQKTATVNLFDFHLSLITDTDDSKGILDNVSRPNLHFDDVIGAEDAKQELKYFVEYLKNPIKYMRKGVRSPRGILLYGPPGTGKTLLAKAMAGESGVTFLKAEGNEFLKRYVGEGAEAVHALFNSARKYAPAIVFIDEIDAIGKSRESLSAGDSTANILTAFLTEMDGFNTDTSRPVFVLAATNYGVEAEKGRSLDAALLRRFDRRIYVDLPNKEERKRYLEMKSAKYPNVKLSKNQLDNIAMRSTGMSLAELESVFEMALRSAIRSETGVVGDAEFEEAFETFNGGEKKEWNSDSLIRTARHEAGHALICWLSGEKPSYLTVVARADHGGYMRHADNEGKGVYTKSELLSNIRTALGGRASEIVYYGTSEGVSTGPSSDLYQATKIAERMICNYGMDQTVGMSYIDLDTANSSVNQVVRDKVNAMLEEELKKAISTIQAHKPAMDAIVEALMEKNHLKENEIDDIFKRTVILTGTN